MNEKIFHFQTTSKNAQNDDQDDGDDTTIEPLPKRLRHNSDDDD